MAAPHERGFPCKQHQCCVLCQQLPQPHQNGTKTRVSSINLGCMTGSWDFAPQVKFGVAPHFLVEGTALHSGENKLSATFSGGHRKSPIILIRGQFHQHKIDCCDYFLTNDSPTMSLTAQNSNCWPNNIAVECSVVTFLRSATSIFSC